MLLKVLVFLEFMIDSFNNLRQLFDVLLDYVDTNIRNFKIVENESWFRGIFISHLASAVFRNDHSSLSVDD